MLHTAVMKLTTWSYSLTIFVICLVRSMFALLSASFCSPVDGKNCVTKFTSDAAETSDILPWEKFDHHCAKAPCVDFHDSR
mmetsp:Transcript_19271/g.63767  ORF Transcript_19271/g.63767 Transcript_19271/m.63767 type:complete len:81 (-) Transcript_19271:1103-1345(-)